MSIPMQDNVVQDFKDQYTLGRRRMVITGGLGIGILLAVTLGSVGAQGDFTLQWLYWGLLLLALDTGVSSGWSP